MSTKYSLTVNHNGTNHGNFCIYQTNDNQHEDIRSLVWFGKAAHPGTKLDFEWGIDYSVVWDEKGTLNSGVVFNASETLPADPQSANSFGFTKSRNAYKFSDTDSQTSQGKLGIHCDGTIPANAASIGIGMSGNAAFACVAAPNIHFTFSPHPRYWIAFGDFEEGEVVDMNMMTNKQEIRFDVNEYHKTITLTGDNTWK